MRPKIKVKGVEVGNCLHQEGLKLLDPTSILF